MAEVIQPERTRARLIGRRYGSWQIVGIAARTHYRSGHHQLRYWLRCAACGETITRATSHLRSLRTHCADERVPADQGVYADEVVVDMWTAWAEDDRCWYVVECHPDGLTLEQVGELMSVTRERVRQIEASALRKLRQQYSEEELAQLLRGDTDANCNRD